MLPKDQARGAILGYFVLYQKAGSESKENQTVDGKETTSYVVTSLEEYTSYQFSVQAFNSKGVSDESTFVGKMTDQDGKFLYMSQSSFFSQQCPRKVLGLLVKTSDHDTDNTVIANNYNYCMHMYYSYLITNWQILITSENMLKSSQSDTLLQAKAAKKDCHTVNTL